MNTQLDVMNELIAEDIIVLKELFEEEVKPLIDYRINIEKKIANKEISEMYKMEREVQ